MSSAGQVAGYVIGGVVGAAFPAVGWVIGAQIGGMIGGYIDPPPGQNTVGPRIEDLTVQTSTYGAELPRIKGTIAVTGNVFWLEGDAIKEHVKTKKVGGKGGPTSKQTTFSYTATFAVGLSQQVAAPIAGIRRLWLANTLVYDAGSGDINSIIASNQQAGVMFHFYDGRDDQEPDPRMQADKGISNVSGYPGRAYIVFYDLDLTEKYNNTLMATQVKVELVCEGATSYQQTHVSTTGVDADNVIVSAVIDQTSVTYAKVRRQSWDGALFGVDFYETKLGQYVDKKIGSIDHPIGGSGYLVTGVGLPVVCQSNIGPCALGVRWHDANVWCEFFLISKSGVVVDTTINVSSGLSPLFTICAVDGGYIYTANDQISSPVQKILNGVSTSQYSGGNIQVVSIGFSESYVFALHYSGSTSATVTVIDKVTMAHVATYTQTLSIAPEELYVISDTEFYVGSEQYLSRWVNGVAENLGAVLHDSTGPDYTWCFQSVATDYFVQFDSNAGGYSYDTYVSSKTITPVVAKLRDIVTDECALAGISSSDLDLTELVNSDVRGYRVSQAGSVRAVLEQLQAAFPFDVIQSGYKLKFKSRGGSSVLTVPESDLGARTGNDTPSRFMLTTEMPSQVPAKITFNFLNADREYDPDEQSAAFTAQDVKNSYAVSLPLVMTPTEALQAADVLLKKEQRERTSAGTFWLPPSDDYRKLEAADVIDVISQGRTHTLRLIKVTQLPDGRIECDGKITASAAYVSTALAQSSLVIGQSLVPLAGSSELVLLDIPRIVSDQDVPGVAVGMYGYTAGWPGGVAFRSDDSGETYNSIVGFNEKTECFTAVNAIGAHNGYAIDSASELIVAPDWSGADLFSITENQLYTYGNLAAYGSDGRWEIVCFKTPSASGGNYIIRDFLRGLYGTEWASGLHVAGDALVMLDLDAVDFAGIPVSAMGSLRIWRGVTAGASIDSSADIDSTYSAVNLKPLSPVDINADRGWFSGDWTITAQRRTRWPVELFSGAAVPLGETAESYDLDILDSSLTTVKRSFSGLPSPAANYPSTDQVTDFGGAQSTIYGRWCQRSSMVGRGFYQYFQITRSASLNPYGEYVMLQMHNDDPALFDVMGHPVTKIGSVARVSDASAYGGYAAAFNGSTDALRFPDSPDWTISGDFLIEARIRVDSLSNAFTILSHWYPGNTSGCAFIFGVLPSGKLFFSYGQGGSAAEIDGTSATVSVGTYAWVAIWRNGSTLCMSVAGSTDATSATISGALNNCPSGLGVGVVSPDISSVNYANGRIDELRFTNGSCMGLTTTWTPPTSALPDPI